MFIRKTLSLPVAAALPRTLSDTRSRVIQEFATNSHVCDFL